MKKNILFLFITLLLTQSLNAQRQRNMYRIAQAMEVQAYKDSLRLYKKKLNETLNGNDSLRQQLELSHRRPETYFMLTPLTYFNGVTKRSFQISRDSDDVQNSIDRAMYSMYLKRPDLVKDNQRNINETGGITFVPTGPMRQNVNFTKQSETESDPAVDDVVVFAPVDLVKVKPNFWTFNGDYALQFLQNYVSANWYKGGESSYAMIGAATLQLNYNDKDKIKFENKLDMKLGMQSSQGDTIRRFKSSEDLLRLTSKLGVQASKKWYYTFQLLAETQFTHGYKNNDSEVYSDFMSPLKLNFALGMDYKVEWINKRLTGAFNISPIATNFKYYGRLNLAKAAGYEEGNHGKWDLGSTITADLTWKFSDVVKWQTRLYGYTTYHRTEVEWENTFTLQLSKYISTKLFIYPRFDDSASKRNDTYGYIQLKEYWSLGFNYAL